MKKLWNKHDKRWYAAALAALVLAAFFIYDGRSQEQPLSSALPSEKREKVKEAAKPEQRSAVSSETAVVDIKGAVVRPGVYEVAKDARVHDVVVRAGGFTKEADQAQINLAAKVHDEMMIYVPAKGEENTAVSAAATPVPKEGQGKIDINRATIEEVEQLQGIGPAKAAAIIEYRETNGPFRQIEDLLNVPGIGEKSLEKIKEQIIVR